MGREILDVVEWLSRLNFEVDGVGRARSWSSSGPMVTWIGFWEDSVVVGVMVFPIYSRSIHLCFEFAIDPFHRSGRYFEAVADTGSSAPALQDDWRDTEAISTL